MAFGNNNIIEKIKAGDNKTLSLIYDLHYPPVEKMILNNNGNSDDAKDVFQETLIVLLRKINSDDFVLTSSLKTYIYSISKNIWLKKLRDWKSYLVLSGNLDESLAENEVNSEEQSDKYIIKKWLLMISEHCRNLIRKMFFENSSLEKIMIFFGYKNMHVTANQKYKCLEQVRKAANFSN